MCTSSSSEAKPSSPGWGRILGPWRTELRHHRLRLVYGTCDPLAETFSPPHAWRGHRGCLHGSRMCACAAKFCSPSSPAAVQWAAPMVRYEALQLSALSSDAAEALLWCHRNTALNIGSQDGAHLSSPMRRGEIGGIQRHASRPLLGQATDEPHIACWPLSPWDSLACSWYPSLTAVALQGQRAETARS